MASKVIYKGVVYGDGVKQVELNTTIKDPLEMDLTPEQIAGEEPLDVRSSYDERNAKLTLNMDIPTALVIANGVVVTDDQKEKYVYTESEELEGVITDKGYKLTYGTLGQRFIWNGMRVLFGRSNFNQDFFKIYDLKDGGNVNRKYYTKQGENINTVFYSTSINGSNTISWPTITGYYYEGSFYEDNNHTTIMTPTDSTFYKDLHTEDIYFYLNSYQLCIKKINLISPEDNVSSRTRVTPADRASIAAGTNEVEKRYIFNFITKNDLYDYVPSGGSTTGATTLSITEKTADYTLCTIFPSNGGSFTAELPPTADTIGFFLWSQYWSSSGAGVGIGLAAFEGEDLVAFLPITKIQYSWAIYQIDSSLSKTYNPWRTYYHYATTNIIEGTYINDSDFEDTNGVHYKTDQPFGTNLFHDTTTHKYYIGTSYYNRLREVEGIVRINEDNSILSTFNVDQGPMPVQTVLSGENSPEFKYAAGITAKLSYVSKTEWEKASGHDIDDGE